MEQKLIFLDIDGTLLPPGDETVPSGALDAIHQARANGHKVFLCTGRNLRMTSPLLQYGFDGYVCSAGGYVCCDDKVLVDIPMEPEQVDGLRAVLNANGVECTLETRDNTYGGLQMIERFANHFKAGARLNSEAERWRKAMEFGMTIRPMSEYQGEPVYKIVYIAPSLASLDEARRKYEDQFVFCEGMMNDIIVNGELINRKFSKGAGIKAICDFLHRPLSATIGFGDSDNDLAMAETVGLSVCMANGSETLKRISDRICPSVEENGVAKEFAALGLI